MTSLSLQLLARWLPPFLAAAVTVGVLIWRLRVNRARTLQLEHEGRERTRLLEVLRRSEALYRNVFEAATDAMVVVGPDGTVRDANAAAEALYGSTTSLRGTPASRLVDGEHLTTADGTVIPVRIRRASLGDVELCTIVDLTAVAELRRELVEIERLDAIGRVAGSIAHDFNNLLVVVKTNLAELGVVPGHEESIRQAQRAVDQGADLIRQLLAVGRQQLLQPTITSLPQLLRRVEVRARKLGPGGGRVQVTADRVCVVSVDGPQLERVLLTLVLHALGRMESKPVSMTASRWQNNWATAQLGPIDGDRDWVVITVSDEGPSLPPDVASRLFEPFAGSTTRPGGALGFSAIHGFVSQSGGHLHVRSADTGTSFHLLLPLVSEHQLENTPPAPPQDRHFDVVVVDDEPMVLRALSRLLASIGHSVRSASSGAEALALFAERPPQVLITDVLMPGMSGPELVARVRRSHPGVGIVYVTGYARDHAASLDAPTVGKPFERTQLEAAILRAVLA